MEKTKSRKKNSGVNSARYFRKNILNLKNANKVLFCLIIVLGIFYVAGANDLAIKGFALSDLKEQSGKIAAENKKLELTIMTLSSLNAISEKVNNLKMVAVGNINYINGSNDTVAKK